LCGMAIGLAEGFNITTDYIMMKNKQYQSRSETEMYQLPIIVHWTLEKTDMCLWTSPSTEELYGAIAPAMGPRAEESNE